MIHSLPKPNHVHIVGDPGGERKFFLDGKELLLAEDGIDITGYDNPENLVEVHLTLLTPRVTMSPGI